MPRIAGVNIPENKRIEISLTYIYGVGKSLSKKILNGLKIDINKKASDLTPKEVNDLKEFIEILKKITIDSIYFHIFEARLRLEKPTNDFSCWIENSLGDKNLANSISSFDPYTSTLEDLRKKLIRIIEKKIP